MEQRALDLISRRLAELERDNRRWRRRFGASLAVGLAALGLALAAHLSPTARVEAQSPNVIRAEEFEVVDRYGVRRASFGTAVLNDREVVAVLRMEGASGETSVFMVGGWSGGPSFQMLGPASLTGQKTSVAFGVRPDGSPHINVLEPSGRRIWLVGE